MFIIVILYALFASTFSLGKMILQYTQPFFLVGCRMTLAGIILIGYYNFFEKNKVTFNKELYWLYLQATLFIIYIPYTLRYWGLQHMPSAQAALLYNLGPFISYIIACLFYEEVVSLQKVCGLIIGFGGIVLLLSTNNSQFSQEIGFMSLPQLAMVFSITSLSYGWIIMSKLLKSHNHPPALINGISMLCGGILGLTTAYFYEPNSLPITEYAPFITILITIIIISNLICHNLYASLLKRYTPTMLAYASFLSPCFTAFYGWLFLQETLSINFFIATCIIFAGLIIFYQHEIQANMRKQKKVILEKSFNG